MDFYILNMNIHKTFGFIIFCLLMLSCNKADVSILGPYTPSDYVLGGSLNSVNDESVNAFSIQASGLVGLDELNFFVGNSFFNQNWVTAPASTTARDGLGPLLNASSCAACHFKDGRGEPIVNNGSNNSLGFLIRLSQPGVSSIGGPVPDPIYGGQLNQKSILGVDHEGDIEVNFEYTQGNYPDGTPYELRKPIYSIVNWMYGEPSSPPLMSPRIGQQMIGLGLLEAIDESTLLSFEDLSDSDGNGVSGKLNYVWDFATSTTKPGKFGWKANQPNLRQQVAGAFVGDLGITSSLFPDENCTSAQMDCQNQPTGGTPEIEDENLDKVVLYASNLSVPIQRDYDDKNVITGRRLFGQIGCTDCHKSKIVTGTHPTFSHLSNQTIYPFTDLLLHDMGEELSDNRPDFLADGNEWRTPPLWGIGLFQTVNDHTYYLHDGRARNLEEAVLWHGGEATQSLELFKQLTAYERSQVIQFLNSL
jgi:CxxC motif-containing protein (DUF1111 family)